MIKSLKKGRTKEKEERNRKGKKKKKRLREGQSEERAKFLKVKGLEGCELGAVCGIFVFFCANALSLRHAMHTCV